MATRGSDVNSLARGFAGDPAEGSSDHSDAESAAGELIPRFAENVTWPTGKPTADIIKAVAMSVE